MRGSAHTRGVDGRSRARNEWLDSRVVKHVRVNTGAKHYLAAVVASAAGEIVGRGSADSGDEADWAGFQLLFVGSPPIPIAAVLELFDQAVADGTLEGQGPGNSARGRLNALRNMLLSASALLAQGNVEAACGQLQDVANRTDGAFPPPDFVQGTAAAELLDAVEALQAELGCPAPVR